MLLYLNYNEKESLRVKRTCLDTQICDVRTTKKFANTYFRGCTFVGEGLHNSFLSCVFEDCTFNFSLSNAKINIFLLVDRATITRFDCVDCNMIYTNIPEQNRVNCFKKCPDVLYFSDIPSYAFSLSELKIK